MAEQHRTVAARQGEGQNTAEIDLIIDMKTGSKENKNKGSNSSLF